MTVVFWILVSFAAFFSYLAMSDRAADRSTAQLDPDQPLSFPIQADGGERPNIPTDTRVAV